MRCWVGVATCFAKLLVMARPHDIAAPRAVRLCPCPAGCGWVMTLHRR